jgi:hypothetical protein
MQFPSAPFTPSPDNSLGLAEPVFSIDGKRVKALPLATPVKLPLLLDNTNKDKRSWKRSKFL